MNRSVKKTPYKKATGKELQVADGMQLYLKENSIGRVGILRKGISYDAIEVISKKLNSPVKSVLSLIGLPQTTYNKKKNENSMLGSKESELVLSITELLEYGLEVFNNEQEKFQGWLKRPNLYLAGNSPESMLDTFTGIHEVRSLLDSLEYGIFA